MHCANSQPSRKTLHQPTAKSDDLFPNEGETTNLPQIDTCHEVRQFIQQAINAEPPALLGASNYLREDDTPREIRPALWP
jgi:hypothetical protein